MEFFRLWIYVCQEGSRVVKKLQQLTSNLEDKVELTGNPFVDNGLATIAALCKCESIEDLALRKMKNLHHYELTEMEENHRMCGESLARNNMRLKSNWMVFINSITQQSSFSNEEKLTRYAKITTAIINKIGHEDKHESCDFCGAPYSLEFSKLFTDTEEHFIGRDWFPMIGSFNDAQGLPGASRSLNPCAKCLYAVQYLPQSSLLVDGLLTLFQSTSVDFWYQFVKNITSDNETKLGAGGNKLETLGKKECSREAINRLLDVMKTSKRYDVNASMMMYKYTNANEAVLKKQLIPNFALNFLHEAAKQGLDKDIHDLTLWEVESKKKASYRYTFFSRITEREDYTRLYPSAPEKKKSNGASPELFLLYQTHILRYPAQSLYTAYKIAQYLKSKVDVEKLSVDIERNFKKQNTVRKWVIEMAQEALLTFDEYYNLFIHSSTDRRNRWWLIKYYLLSQSDMSEFKKVGDSDIYNPEYKSRVVKVGNMILDRILEEKGEERFKKLLSKFAKGTVGRNWLITQFEKLADDNKDFDYSDNWRMLCIDEYGREDIYQFLYLLRLLFTIRIYKGTA
jgi:CRISPR-associated protein Cst1